ncbi:MAG: hypothetical protein JST39_07340 [Bacteroidetes bacterium]|nr:hypothetical protein [Bacteroidota bacterium]
MKTPYIITMFNLVLALLITFGLSGAAFKNSNGGVFMMFFGAVCVVGGVGDLIIAFFIYVFNGSPEWKKGFLISAGIFFLLGAGICGPMLLS